FLRSVAAQGGHNATPRRYLPDWMHEEGLGCRNSECNLEGSKEEVPSYVNGGVDEGGGEDRAGLAPGPAIEKAGDGSQDHVAPIGKAHVGDVREAKDNRGNPPTREVTFSGARKDVLEQAAEEKLFRPGSEK